MAATLPLPTNEATFVSFEQDLLPSSVPTHKSKELLEVKGLHEIAGVFRGRELTRKERRLTCGITPIDNLIGGGIVRGRISEIVGLASAGKTTLAASFAAAATCRGEVVAWIDASGNFDPASTAAAGVDLARMLWVAMPVTDKRRGYRARDEFERREGECHHSIDDKAISSADLSERALRDSGGLMSREASTCGRSGPSAKRVAGERPLEDYNFEGARFDVTPRAGVREADSVPHPALSPQLREGSESRGTRLHKTPLDKERFCEREAAQPEFLIDDQASRSSSPFNSYNNSHSGNRLDSRSGSHSDSRYDSHLDSHFNSHFESYSAAGYRVKRSTSATALKAAEWILAAGGFGLVVIDYGNASSGRIAFMQSAALRLARGAERSGAAVLIIASQRMCGTFAALSLTLSRTRACFSRTTRQAPALFDGLTLEARVMRNKLGGAGGAADWRALMDTSFPPTPELALRHPVFPFDSPDSSAILQNAGRRAAR